MGIPRIIICGFGPHLGGLHEKPGEALRVSRLVDLEVILTDQDLFPSSPQVIATKHGWVFHNLANAPDALVNGVPVAEALGLSSGQREQVRVGTPLHDIGKIGISDGILQKPGKLTAEEFEEIKTHTVKGATMVGGIPGLRPILPIIRHHHERWDGTGYPDRLSGEGISLLARIVAVADAFDAMTSARPYRPALPLEQAFKEIAGKSGTHFAPGPSSGCGSRSRPSFDSREGASECAAAVENAGPSRARSGRMMRLDLPKLLTRLPGYPLRPHHIPRPRNYLCAALPSSSPRSSPPARLRPSPLWRPRR